VLSALWLVAYVLIYPAIPFAASHSPGLGVPGGCQPWSAICEMRQAEQELQLLRGDVPGKIEQTPVEQVWANAASREYSRHTGRVLFGENCAGCHGKFGA
ncbi:MAG: hypothetical protein AAB278_06270, partial [Pseudomonadota bacterium]